MAGDGGDIACTLDGAHTLCSYAVSDDGGFHKIALQVSCEDGLCPGAHFFPVSVTGLKNRYSAARGPLPLEEVYFETFDATGAHQVDYSPAAGFIDELTSGTAAIDVGTFQLTNGQVGQQTDCSFLVAFDGLVHDEDSLEIEIKEIPFVDYSGLLFTAEPASSTVLLQGLQGASQSIF